MNKAEQRLAKLGLELPAAPQPVANYVPFRLAGNQLFFSGQISRTARGHVLTGTLGYGVTIEAGQAAPRCAALPPLGQAKGALGSLGRIAQILRLTGFVTAAAGFMDHPKVINVASDLLVDVPREAGHHTDTALGVTSLPMGASVELDAIMEIR